MESKRRSLAKALSWRVIAWSITATIAYLYTGKAAFALSLGFADSLLKIFAYYLHERTWMSVNYGRTPQPQFNAANEEAGELAQARS
ncbi:MAG: DUF2061 domain-containing protein [Myxococcota bacterium]